MCCIYESTDDLVDVPGYSGVVPRADTCLGMEKVHLALLCGPLLCKSGKKRDVRKVITGGTWLHTGVNNFTGVNECVLRQS